MHREGAEHQTNFAPANRVINLDSDSAASISKRAATTVRTRVNSPPLSVESLTARVYEHADRGESPQEIARRLDEHVGKVELILALRKQADRPAQIRA
jgi:hypothetical protein